ncbi:hypothetical protein [Zunongwangia endophytica]|uniref:DUF423 domain-containing protein n=1 Tax=Zunongwangia endophytica TaxID=1808945 RepID=A0ABV8HAD9_9FLAO|nr:hypothetical protein [Zunongwangia endophytica]MDN3594764.1 hypothetical protein [Zunongwangia endophytica]
MQERLAIIDIFRFNKKEISDYDKKIKRLKMWSYFIIFYCALAWSLILSTIILDLTGNNSFLKWNEAGVVVMMAIVALIFCSKILSQIKLLKHEKFLQNSSNINSAHNKEFEKLVKKANLRFYPELPLAILCIIILISAVLITIFKDMQYSVLIWNYAKIAIVLFFVIEVFSILKLQKELKENIHKTENK